MGLKLFADHCVSNQIVEFLKNMGHEVLLLREVMPHDSPDPSVIAKAKELNAILISLNGDFADIVVYPPSDCGGIIALQVRNHPETIPHLLERLSKYFSVFPDMDNYKGRLVLVEPHRIRVKG
jgi:predicted nuclease of predicted toxin-antitoxin system